MKTPFLLPAMFMTLFITFNSCGVNNALVANQNQNSTQVHLTSNNYNVLERVSGSAEIDYLFFIGGISRKQLYENAYADMMKKANLMSSSKALINIVTEDHVGGVPPFYFKRTITVSAYVIEFTD